MPPTLRREFSYSATLLTRQVLTGAGTKLGPTIVLPKSRAKWLFVYRLHATPTGPGSAELYIEAGIGNAPVVWDIVARGNTLTNASTPLRQYMQQCNGDFNLSSGLLVLPGTINNGTTRSMPIGAVRYRVDISGTFSADLSCQVVSV